MRTPSFSLVERTVRTVEGPRQAWILEPRTHLVVDAERLEAFERGEHPKASVDREIVDAVRATESPSQLLVFCASSRDGAGSWGFEKSLDQAECRALGYHLVRDQLPMYRRLVAAGVFGIVHVDFGAREVDAYQFGTTRALEELERRSIPEPSSYGEAIAVLQVDRWILHNLAFYFTLPLEDVVETVLERQLPLLADRIPNLRRLSESLPPSAID